MSILRILFLLPLALCIAPVRGEANKNEPHIGYLYPAGGQQGTTVQIVVGGQFLKGATDVYISGEGVNASVVKYYKPLINIKKEQRELLRQRLKEVRDRRLKELGIDPRQLPNRNKAKKKKSRISKKEKSPEEQNAAKNEVVKMPNHPLLVDLDNKSLRELAHIRDTLFFPRRMKQRNRQLAESVLINITIDENAKPGNREMRIQTHIGLTNPVVFQVGTLPEVRELEPNNEKAYPKYLNVPDFPKEKPIEMPAVLNGQIMPGDVDRFRFTAQKGQKLVIETYARSLIPYLSDTVPGWFQATLALYNDKNNEVAFDDDYRFNPDPVLFYKIPKSGEYELEIRDSLYRGREDFVYRISISEQPFITQVFPLGCKANSRAFVSIDGWNLLRKKLPLDTQPDGDNIRHMTYDRGKLISNPITYAVDRLTESVEIESNDSIKAAQPVTLPIIINGRVDKPGDVDIFKFKGSSGGKVVAEVCARQLNSPVDSLLRLIDANGTVRQWNDDYISKDGYLYKDIIGLETHHADSYVMATLPKNGNYYVQLSDSQNQGGPAYDYRLRISEPQGDFALRVTPSSLYTYAGATVAMHVYVLRKDGFNDEIQLALKDAPAGFELKGGKIPAGRNDVRITLTTPPDAPAKAIALKFQGIATIAGRKVSRLAVPAEDMMQAFLYRHLVPSQQLLIAVQKRKWPSPRFEFTGDEPVCIATGSSARVRFKIAKRKVFHNIELQLNQPPQGLTLYDVKVDSGVLSFKLKVDKELNSTRFVGNLIVEAFKKFRPKNNNNKTTNKKRRISIGYLPAIPIEIAKQ